VISGALAAAATPLREGGAAVDEAGVAPLVDFLGAAGLDGMLVLGTTGEGILLSTAERKVVARRFVDAAGGRLRVAVHCGAQTTDDTVVLARNAAEISADAVAVIAPPYFALDDEALLQHFAAAAAACAPLAFFVYEFERTSGYAVPPHVVEALREQAPNLAGLKVSDTPWERFRPYLIEGLDVFVGPEALIAQGMQAGAAGAVSALATAFPELVAACVREPTEERTARLAELRATIERFPRHAALKHVLRVRGVPIGEDVRQPLRALTSQEAAELDRLLPAWLLEEQGSAK
jgi:dihydrodipicolinate synthase/N-acetylneuraminate lyase